MSSDPTLPHSFHFALVLPHLVQLDHLILLSLLVIFFCKGLFPFVFFFPLTSSDVFERLVSALWFHWPLMLSNLTALSTHVLSDFSLFLFLHLLWLCPIPLHSCYHSAPMLHPDFPNVVLSYFFYLSHLESCEFLKNLQLFFPRLKSQ